MNPETKLLLEEIDKRFGACFDDLKAQIATNADASATRLKVLEDAVQAFDEWRLSVDGVVDDLKIEVDKLSKLKVEVGRLSKHWDRVVVDGSVVAPGVFASAPASPTAFVPDLHTDASLDTKAIVRSPTTSSIGPGRVSSEWSPL
jgi:hypothetical protein